MLSHIGRWAGLGASALLTATGLLVSPHTAPVASADDCPDVEVIFARGTNEPPGLGHVGDAFVDSLRQQTGGMKFDTYGVNYAASKLQLHGGDGANDTINRVKQAVAKCPSTKIVLGGYSQGSTVIDLATAAVPPSVADHVAAVALFGEPSSGFSSMLWGGQPLPGISPQYAGKTISLCAPDDPICSPGGNIMAHVSYIQAGMTNQAATFAANKLGSARQNT